MTAMTYVENINLKVMPRVVRLVALLVALQSGHCNALWANRYFAQPKLKRADTLICNGVIPIVGFSLFFFDEHADRPDQIFVAQVLDGKLSIWESTSLMIVMLFLMKLVFVTATET